MSVASQFFPSGSGGGGGSATGIPVEILGVGGGGGGGTPVAPCNAVGGTGGAGGLFHATNYTIVPGTTVPITIGSGGPFGGCPCGQGTIGGTTSFNYPELPISVCGGGGGAGKISVSSGCCGGCPGGNGGGGFPSGGTYNSLSTPAGCGLYYEKLFEHCAVSYASPPTSCGGVATYTYARENEHQKFPWGIKAGYPGKPGYYVCSYPGYKNSAGCGGKSGSNGTQFCACCWFPSGGFTCFTVNSIPPTYYCSSITGNNVGYGETTGCGGPGPSFSAGGPGVLIIQWATSHGAAPPTGFPGGADISPETPGYYTYCFTTSGSITLP